MDKVFCFGELLLRFSPQLQGKWMDQAMMPVYVGGAELNVATALALWSAASVVLENRSPPSSKVSHQTLNPAASSTRTIDPACLRSARE